jgi:hypothetical protein
LLGLRFRILSAGRLSVFWECCLLSCRDSDRQRQTRLNQKL